MGYGKILGQLSCKKSEFVLALLAENPLTVEPKSVDDAFYILNSDSCTAVYWNLKNICHLGLATDSTVALGIFTNGLGIQGPEIGADF